MKKISFIILLLTLLSCSSNNKELVIQFENSLGVSEGDPVVINNRIIGEVTKVSLDKHYKPLITIYLDKMDHLPKDSKFTIGAKDLLIRAIVVTPGKSKTWLSTHDRIIGITPLMEPADTSGTDYFEKLILSLPVRDEDSIQHKMNRLNEELQNLKQQIPAEQEKGN